VRRIQRSQQRLRT